MRRCEFCVLIDEVLGALLESLAVFVGPPRLQRAVAVILRTLVVESVTNLVTDDSADCSVVDGVVGVEAEERWLQNRSRKYDLVEARVVVGVHCLRGHEPLVAVDW